MIAKLGLFLIPFAKKIKFECIVLFPDTPLLSDLNEIFYFEKFKVDKKNSIHRKDNDTDKKIIAILLSFLIDIISFFQNKRFELI